MNIKETKELLAALKVLAKTGAAIAKDGVKADDLAKLLPLFQQYAVILEGFKGVDLVVAEAKDLDSVEVMEIVNAVLDIVKEVKAELAVAPPVGSA